VPLAQSAGDSRRVGVFPPLSPGIADEAQAERIPRKRWTARKIHDPIWALSSCPTTFRSSVVARYLPRRPRNPWVTHPAGMEQTFFIESAGIHCCRFNRHPGARRRRAVANARLLRRGVLEGRWSITSCAIGYVATLRVFPELFNAAALMGPALIRPMMSKAIRFLSSFTERFRHRNVARCGQLQQFIFNAAFSRSRKRGRAFVLTLRTCCP